MRPGSGVKSGPALSRQPRSSAGAGRSSVSPAARRGVGEGGEEAFAGFEEGFGGVRVEKVGIVVEFQPRAADPGQQVEAEIKLCVTHGDRERADAQAGEIGRGVDAVVVDRHRDQRRARRVAAQVERTEDRGERVVGVGVGVEEPGFGFGEHLAQGRVGRKAQGGSGARCVQ